MNAPLAKEQIALLMSDKLPYSVSAVQGTDTTLPASRQNGIAALARRAGDAVRFVMELPQRRAVIDELSRLSDRELADIGLHRNDLKQVFAGRK